jgi:hypothetical protein
VNERWLCWPDPDKVCLEGGCGYCVPDKVRKSVRSPRGHKRVTFAALVAIAEDRQPPVSVEDMLESMTRRAVQ